MVEMTQAMFRKVFIYALGAAFLTAGALHAQQPKVEARIAGLEGNAEYMSLLREDAQLQLREDSIVNAVERMRQRLREDPSRRQELSQEILQQESRIFEIRNAKGRLIDRINTIEQEWVLANLNGAAQQPAGPAAADPAATVPDSLKVRNLVDNLYFREHLRPGIMRPCAMPSGWKCGPWTMSTAISPTTGRFPNWPNPTPRCRPRPKPSRYTNATRLCRG